jgi:hypothetical protein
MWSLFGNSVSLFFTGRLFRDPLVVFRQWLIGFAFSLVAVIVAVKLGAPLDLSVIVVALLAGFLQPFLFKNLKYA